MDFVAREVELVAPGEVVLCHHDDWLPGFSVPTDVAPLRDAIKRGGSQLVGLGDVDATEILTGVRP